MRNRHKHAMNADRPELEAQIEHLEGLLTAAARERHALLERLGRYRTALARIANAESGLWGRIAHDALANDHKDGAREP